MVRSPNLQVSSTFDGSRMQVGPTRFCASSGKRLADRLLSGPNDKDLVTWYSLGSFPRHCKAQHPSRSSPKEGSGCSKLRLDVFSRKQAQARETGIRPP